MASIADVWITVLPNTAKVGDGIRDALRRADPVVAEAARRWGQTLERELSDVKATVEVDADTTKAKAQIEEATRDRTVRVDVDRSSLDRLSGASADLASLGKVQLGFVGIGSLPAAATAIANVAGALQQVAGAGLAIPGLMAGLVSSVGTAALGMNGMGDALKAVNKAADGTRASVDAANAALAKLAPNVAETVRTTAGLRGTFTDLQNIAGQNMFAGVSAGLKSLVAADLPAVTKGIDAISRGLNQNILQAFNSLSSGSSQGFLQRILGNTGDAQSRLTGAIEPIVNAMGTLAAAGSDTLPRLATAITAVSKRFDNFITGADADGRLAGWIDKGLTGFTQLGNIVLDLGKSFTAITQAAGGGEGLLGLLERLTSEMATFLNSAAGQQQLGQFFESGRQTLGQLKDIAIQLGPILGQVFDSGLSAANLWLPVIHDILTTINAIPGGANLVVGAFLGWKYMQGVSSLTTALTTVGTTLGGLPAKAEGAAAGINRALATIVVPAIGEMLNSQLDQWLKDEHPALYDLNHTNTPDDLGKQARDWVNEHIFGNPPAPIIDPRTGLPASQSTAPSSTRDSGGVPGAGAINPSTGLPYGQNERAGAPAPISLGGPAGAQRERRGLSPATVSSPTISSPPVLTPSSYTAPVVTQPSSSSSPSAFSVGGVNGIMITPENIAETIGLAQQASGKPYGYGGVGPGSFSEDGPGLYDCSGFMSDIYAALTGKPYKGNERYFTTESDFTKLGFVKGFDPNSAFNIGVHNGGGGKNSHMAGTLFGTAVESGGNGTLFGGKAAGANDPQFENQYHLPSTYDSSLSSYYSGISPATTGATSALTGSKNNPMYVDYSEGSNFSKQSSGPSGEQLGQDIFSGILELFGVDGTVFKNPMNGGLFKGFKGLTSFFTGLAGAQGQSTGGDGASLPGGDMFSGALSALTGIQPQAFGPLQVGGQDRIPADHNPQPGRTPGPGNSGGGADYSINFYGPVGQPHAAMDAAQSANIPRMRQGMRPLPS